MNFTGILLISLPADPSSSQGFLLSLDSKALTFILYLPLSLGASTPDLVAVWARSLGGALKFSCYRRPRGLLPATQLRGDLFDVEQQPSCCIRIILFILCFCWLSCQRHVSHTLQSYMSTLLTVGHILSGNSRLSTPPPQPYTMEVGGASDNGLWLR